MNARLRFGPHRGGTRCALAEVEIHFEGGMLDGVKVVGITVWEGKGKDGPFVTLPAHGRGEGQERRYFDFLRPVVETAPVVVQRLKKHILNEYVNWLRDTPGGRTP